MGGGGNGLRLGPFIYGGARKAWALGTQAMGQRLGCIRGDPPPACLKHCGTLRPCLLGWGPSFSPGHGHWQVSTLVRI